MDALRKRNAQNPGRKTQDAALERKVSEQEVEGPVEVETDKEENKKTESELKSSEPKLILPAQFRRPNNTQWSLNLDRASSPYK